MPKRASFSAISIPKKSDEDSDMRVESSSPNPFQVIEVDESAKPVMKTIQESQLPEDITQDVNDQTQNEIPTDESSFIGDDISDKTSEKETEDKQMYVHAPVHTDMSDNEQQPDANQSPADVQEEPIHRMKSMHQSEVSDLFKKPSEQSPTIEDESVKFPEITISEKEGLKPIVFWAIALVVAVVIIGAGLIAIKQGTLPQNVIPILPKPTPTVMPTPTTAVTPTPTLPAVNKENISIKVLNGSGVTGAAKKMKDLLEDKGYTVSSIGNADADTYEQTTIKVKAGKEYLIQMIKADFKGSYTVGKTSSDLGKSSAVDVEVIIGKS